MTARPQPWPEFAAAAPVVEPEARLRNRRRGPELDDVNAGFGVVCCRFDGLQARAFSSPRAGRSDRAVGQGSCQEQAG